MIKIDELNAKIKKLTVDSNASGDKLNVTIKSLNTEILTYK